MFRIKVCGIRDPESATVCHRLGVDAIGFNFYPPSKRFVPAETVCQFRAEIPDDLKCIGLFVNADAETIRDLAKRLHLDAIQLHGDEKPSILDRLELPEEISIIRAIRISPQVVENSLAEIESWQQHPGASRLGAFLLDAHHDQEYGGTGRTIDWDWLSTLDLPTDKPLILAGGLTPENVGEACARVRPHGVDVAGGVESRPGVKDHLRIEKFVKAVRQSVDRI